MSGADFNQAVTAAYAEIVHWRQNLFLTPSGKAGKRFTCELAKMFRSYAEGTALEPIALKAAMIMPTLLLQKPHESSKTREHVACLHRRLQAWQEGDINNLVIEGRTIQHRLKKYRRTSRESEQQIGRRFAKLMMQGKVKAALRLLSDEGKGAPLSLETQITTQEHHPATTVRNELLKKHPPGQPAHPNALLHPDPTTPLSIHPVIFDCLDGAAIRSAALHTNGSAGPSGIDANGWRRLCTSFQTASTDLCSSIASVARKLCTTYVDPEVLAPLTASRLIALDKCPGVRPIGVGETVRRIIGKAILAVIKVDVL